MYELNLDLSDGGLKESSQHHGSHKKITVNNVVLVSNTVVRHMQGNRTEYDGKKGIVYIILFVQEILAIKVGETKLKTV